MIITNLMNIPRRGKRFFLLNQESTERFLVDFFFLRKKLFVIIEDILENKLNNFIRALNEYIKNGGKDAFY